MQFYLSGRKALKAFKQIIKNTSTKLFETFRRPKVSCEFFTARIFQNLCFTKKDFVLLYRMEIEIILLNVSNIMED